MIIITGGAGFIGSAVLWQLNEMGIDDIIIVDNLGKTEKWRNLVKRSYIDYIHRDAFREMIHGKSLKLSGTPEAVVHLGACSSTTQRDADFLMSNNFQYSRDLCRFALEKGARFINASSAATYGAGEYGFCETNALKLKPLNMYGYSKQLFDLWMLKEGLDKNLASLKFFNVYGPNEYHKGEMQSVIAKIYKQINETGEAFLFASHVPGIENGGQKRDFVYVKDCAQIIAWLLTDGKETNGILNVGTGQARTFKELAQNVFKAMNRAENIIYKEMPDYLKPNYQNYTCAQMDWLKKENYPRKMTSLEKGIADYVGKYLAKKDSYL